MDELQGPMPDGSSLGDAGYGAGLTAQDGLAAFNTVLSTWLQHDVASMRQNQPVAYAGTVKTAMPAQQSNRNLLLLIGLGVLAFVAFEAEYKG
jgi:hypothetical protein